MKKTSVRWNDEEIEALREMVASRTKTYSEMGAELGRSRNAVAGEMKRLGLRSEKPIIPINIVNKKKPKYVVYKPPKHPTLEGAFMVSLIDVKEGQCRYPASDDNHRCCGLPIHHKSYCEAHARICYVPVKYDEEHQIKRFKDVS